MSPKLRFFLETTKKKARNLQVINQLSDKQPFQSPTDLTDSRRFFTLLPFKVPQISQIHTDFFFYFFIFKSHADLAFPSAADFQFADDADFLPFYFFTLLPLKVPTDLTDSHRFLPFYFFTFKSHADCADDADFFYLFTFLLFYL